MGSDFFDKALFEFYAIFLGEKVPKRLQEDSIQPLCAYHVRLLWRLHEVGWPNRAFSIL